MRSTGWPLVRAFFSPPSFCLSASLTSLYPIQCLLTGSSLSALCQPRSSPFSKAQLHPCPQPCVLTSSPLGPQTLTRLSFRILLLGADTPQTPLQPQIPETGELPNDSSACWVACWYMAYHTNENIMFPLNHPSTFCIILCVYFFLLI